MPIMTSPEEISLRGAAIRLAPVLLLVATMLAMVTGTQRAEARPLWTGITNIQSNEQLAFDRTKSAGSRFVRIPLLWNQAAPASKPASWNPSDPADPNYRWADNDINVQRATAAGLVPVLQIVSAPNWAQRCQTPPVLPDAECDPDPTALAQFATAAARRYSGKFPGLPRVKYWQALNEPNLSLFFFPQFNTAGKALSARLYKSLVNAFYDAVKAVDRSNLVVAAGLGPIAVPKWTIGPIRFTRELLCMQGRETFHPAPGKCAPVRFDIFAIQPYTTGGPTHVGGINDVQLGGLGRLKSLLVAADKAHRIKGVYKHTPLWVTEFSWDTQPPDPGGLPMEIATRWVSEALHEAWKAGVSAFFWFSLRDDERTMYSPPYSATLESGLYFRGVALEQDRPKEILGSFRFPFVAYPRKLGLEVWGRTPTSSAGKVRIEAWTGSTWRKLMTVRADKTGVFTGTSKSRYGQDREGLVRAVYAGDGSPPFAMRGFPDRTQPPFG